MPLEKEHQLSITVLWFFFLFVFSQLRTYGICTCNLVSGWWIIYLAECQYSFKLSFMDLYIYVQY